MERWEEIYKNTIPVGKYKTLVKNGEEVGLIIKLEDNEYIVNIDFGIVSAFRMLDEGIALKGIFDENEILKYKKNNFSNTIYKIQDGEFGKFIKRSSNELYDYLDLEHYVIITMNYIIEVISEWEPSIEISKK
ncbi:hypothetical protein [Clostridium sp. UBA6640]|uniref:hypothetical protein n=1 Tax=Clostridium sp. UBA6640 TaxID=1946370 RepID=UPI0025C2C368|nr:hypothetical protein [Clostridium sp. UBA6640]